MFVRSDGVDEAGIVGASGVLIFREEHHVADVVEDISCIKGLPVAAVVTCEKAIRASL